MPIGPGKSGKAKRRVRRVVRKALVVLLALVVPAAALVYGLASRIPSDYREALQRVTRLNKPGDPRKGFWYRVGKFSKGAGAGKPFTWYITADEVNLYLASMDEIAALPPSEKLVRPTASLKRAGFSDPAVAMCDGMLTLMIWSRQYKKVLSVDLTFIFDERGDARMEILAMRVGVLPVPKALLESRLRRLREKLRDLLARANDAGKERFGAVSAKDVAKFLRVVVGMLDGKAVRPEVVWNFGARHRMLIEKVEIADGKLTLHFEPIPRQRPTSSTAPAPDGGL